MRVGIVGLGLMGSAMAERLLVAGYDVAGFDISESACQKARCRGVDVLCDAQAIARHGRLILLSLLTSEERRELLWGPQSMASALASGTLILDTTTGRPEDTREDCMRLAEQGVRLIDVCISGSSLTTIEGRAIALVGDTRENAHYESVLATFTAQQHYFGRPGQANEAKLIVNLVYGLHRAALAEALSLAARSGFDLNAMLDVLKAGDTYSVVMDTKGPKMVEQQFEPAAARVAQHTKDAHLILEFAESVGAPVPLSEINTRMLEKLVDAGEGHLDNAAIFKAYYP